MVSCMRVITRSRRASGIRIASADVPGNHQLDIGIQRCPRPNVASAFWSRPAAMYVLVFGLAERPDLVAAPLAGQAANVLIVIGDADITSIHQQLQDRVDRHIADPRDRPHRAALTEHSQDLNSAICSYPSI